MMEGRLMRPWVIVLSSAIFAIIVVVAFVDRELAGAARPDFWPVLLPHFPTLAVAGFGIYALCAMLLTIGMLVGETLLIRHRLGEPGRYRGAAGHDWRTAFGSIGFQRLVPGLVDESGQTGTENETVLLRVRFDAGSARSEIGRLHYLWLARTHFFSAFIALTALVGLGLAQERGTVPLALGTIPTLSAILILAGLTLLAILGRIALDVSAEPLIETISQLPIEPIEAAVLRRAVEVIEAVHAAAVNVENAPRPPGRLPERVETIIEEGERALLEAVRHLLATTEELGAMMRSSVEAIATGLAQLPTIVAQERGVAGLAELQVSIETLIAVLERLTTLPDIGEEVSTREHGVPSGKTEPQLARQLQQLIEEIGATR
jgi:hypothetical protein